MSTNPCQCKKRLYPSSFVIFFELTRVATFLGGRHRQKYWNVKRNRVRGNDLLVYYALVIGFPEGGGEPRADVGTLLIVHFKVLVLVPSIWRSQTPNRTRRPRGEDTLQDFSRVLWTVIPRLHILIKTWTLFLFLEYVSCSKSLLLLYMCSLLQLSPFLSILDSTESVLNLSGLMTDTGEHMIVTVHLLLPNKTLFTCTGSLNGYSNAWDNKRSCEYISTFFYP